MPNEDLKSTVRNQIKRRQGIMGGNRYIENDIYNKILLEARELYGRL